VDLIHVGLDNIMPVKKIKLRLIKVANQKAPETILIIAANTSLYKFYRNRVNRET
jgi:hypothetical protein